MSEPAARRRLRSFSVRWAWFWVLLTRIATFGISVTMLVAIATDHGQVGFFMNWAGTQKGEGFEYHLLVLAITCSFARGATRLCALMSDPR